MGLPNGHILADPQGNVGIMGIEIKTENWTVPASLVDLVPLTSDPETQKSYPKNLLRDSGKQHDIETEVVVLENEFIRCTIAPGFGGRIIEFFDKRNDFAAIARPTELDVQFCKHLGVGLNKGLRPFSESTEEFGFSPVSYQIVPPLDDDSLGGVLLGDVTNSGLDWTICLTLHPKHAYITLEFRVHNRTLLVKDLTWGLTDFGWQSCGNGNWVSANGLGISIETGQTILGDSFPQLIGPRQVRLLKASLSFVPVGSSTLRFCNGIWATHVNGTLTIDSAKPYDQCLIQIESQEGNKFESKSNLDPQCRITARFEKPIEHLHVVSKDGKVTSLNFVSNPSTRPNSRSVSLNHKVDHESELLSPEFEGHLIYGAAYWVAVAREHSKNCQWVQAQEALSHAINLNAEDQHLWWFRLVLQRKLLEDDSSETALNAHFLAPLEPLLKAESFLAQFTVDQTVENPFIQQLASDPNSLLDVVHEYLAIGQVQDSTVLLTEALRHRPGALIKAVYAWLVLDEAKMEAEAANQVLQLNQMAIEPPFPYRFYEIKAIEGLANRFQDSPILRELLKLSRIKTSS